MSQNQRHLTTNSNPPNQGRGRIPPPSTTNQRFLTLDGNPPNNGTPPSATHPSPPPRTATPPSNTLVTMPFAPAPTPHPLQITPPTFLTYTPPPITTLAPQMLPTPDWEYVMLPSGPVQIPPSGPPNNGIGRTLPPHHQLPPPQDPHAYTPPTALPLTSGTYYLPPTTPHTTLLHFARGPTHPWRLPASAVPLPKSYTVPLAIGIHDLIKLLGGETVGNGAGVGVTTCTLWKRSGGGWREVDPREWMVEEGRGGWEEMSGRRRSGGEEWEWRRGETYTLGNGEGSGAGEEIGRLQGFRDGRGRGRGSVGVVAHVGG